MRNVVDGENADPTYLANFLLHDGMKRLEALRSSDFFFRG